MLQHVSGALPQLWHPVTVYSFPQLRNRTFWHVDLLQAQLLLMMGLRLHALVVLSQTLQPIHSFLLKFSQLLRLRQASPDLY